MSFLLVSKILNVSLVTKMIEKIIPLCIFCPKMIIYRRDFDKTKFMYFLIKNLFFFLKNIMKFGKKNQQYYQKEYNGELMYNKKCLKAEKIQYKEGCDFIFKRAILIDTVYKKMKTIMLKC